MIRSFIHKGLEDFAATGNGRKLPVSAAYHRRVRAILVLINGIVHPSELANVPGYRYHLLKQYTPLRHSVDVNGNVRIIFEWEDGDAVNVWIGDPH